MTLKKVLYIYLIFWSSLALIVILSCMPHPTGEWDDYSLVTASIINDQNVSISKDDVEFAKQFFPDLKGGYDNGYFLSGFKTRNGDEMAWYFCTYSVACVPIAVLLSILNLNPSYCFYITNLITMILALYLCIKEYQGNIKNKLFLILLLSLNPIFFYMTWISAEVFIYALLIIAMLWWCEKRYKRSAIAISLAATLNPTILFVGIIMIIDFIFNTLKKYNIKTMKDVFISIMKEKSNIILYGSCYIISIIPFIYNYYETGYINLTAATFTTHESKVMIIKRFIAYVLDWNFGLLPYYNFFLILSFFLIIIAVLKKCWKFNLMLIAFYGTIFGYSIMIHINSGMSGIARYNAWSSVILIFAVITYMDTLLIQKVYKTISSICIIVTLLCSSLIILIYGPLEANNTSHIYMTPIASYVLDNFPNLYSPLHSTFNSRITHIDGGYSYTLPLVYKDDKGNIRKILIDPLSTNKFKTMCYGETYKDQEWLDHKLIKINKEEYITVPLTYKLIMANKLNENQTITFSGNNRNCEDYVNKGISGNEGSFAWTSGKEMNLDFIINNYEPNSNYNLECNIFGVYNGKQSIVVYQNDHDIYNNILTNNTMFQIKLKPTDTGYVRLVFKFDNAISPLALNKSSDDRVLALQFKNITLIKK